MDDKKIISPQEFMEHIRGEIERTKDKINVLLQYIAEHPDDAAAQQKIKALRVKVRKAKMKGIAMALFMQMKWE